MDDARLQADLRRYWDEFVEGGPVAPEELDPELITLIRRLHALGEVRPDATYATRLRETLMQTTAMPRPRVAPLVRPGLNGRPTLPVRSPLVPLTPVSGRPQIVAHLATAALLMLLAVGSVFLFGPGRSDQHGESPALVPAISSPPATPEPSPMTGPVEFLWETRGDPASPLGNPSHLAVAPDGSIWVADADNNRFQIFAPDGTFLEAWGTPGSGEGEFDFTTLDWGGHDQAAIAFAPDGTFYVADPGNHRIQKFGPDRGFLTAWGSEGQEPGQFGTPIDLVVDGQGRVYVLDANRVQVFDADGRFLAEWGERGFEPGQLFGPFGIGLDPDGTLLIAEFDGNRVQRFTPEGEFLDGWGGPGSGDGQFAYAMDAAVDAAGRVFVTDYSNHRVQVFDRDGQFLAAWGEPGTDAGQFISALSVAVGGDGIVYVTDGVKRLQAFRVGELPAAASAATPSG